MKICIIGGIFDKDEQYRAVVTLTPETVLLAGLAARGHEVEARGHWSTNDLSGFDVVHVHHLGPGAVACAVDRQRAPFVFTNHSFAHPSLLYALAFRFVAARADAVVALSEREASWQRHQRHLGDRQYVIPNGIDETVFGYVPPRADRGEPWRLLYVGQLIPVKGLDYLVDALAILQRRCSVGLDLVYQVDTRLPALKARVDALRISGVRFLGNRSPSELAEIYAACDLLVLPSVSEALPSVISEAMLVGRPVVASDVGGIKDQIGRFGAVVAPRDSVALASAVERVLGNYERYAAIASDESAKAMRRFSVAAMVDAHEALYERVQRSPARRHAARYAAGSWASTRALCWVSTCRGHVPS